MPQLITTKRMTLRPLKRGDFEFLRSLHSDPEVMKYIGSGSPRAEDETRLAMDKYFTMEDENPFLGAWIAFLTDSKEEIGNLIIRKPATKEETEGYEIGYSFHPQHWGKGYATEAAKEIIEYAYRVFGPVQMVALIEPSNEASRKTLTKLGFHTSGFSDYVDPSTGLIKKTEVLLK